MPSSGVLVWPKMTSPAWRKRRTISDSRGDTLTLADQTEEDVLGPDVVVIEQARFLLGEDNDPSRSVGEALEQNETASR